MNTMFKQPTKDFEIAPGTAPSLAQQLVQSGLNPEPRHDSREKMNSGRRSLGQEWIVAEVSKRLYVVESLDFDEHVVERCALADVREAFGGEDVDVLTVLRELGLVEF